MQTMLLFFFVNFLYIFYYFFYFFLYYIYYIFFTILLLLLSSLLIIVLIVVVVIVCSQALMFHPWHSSVLHMGGHVGIKTKTTKTASVRLGTRTFAAGHAQEQQKHDVVCGMCHRGSLWFWSCLCPSWMWLTPMLSLMTSSPTPTLQPCPFPRVTGGSLKGPSWQVCASQLLSCTALSVALQHICW